MEVAVLNDYKTGILNASWDANAERLNTCKFIISESTGTVYMASGVKKLDNGRVNFKHLYKAPPEIQKRYEGFVKGRKRGDQNPVHYYEALD